MAENLLVIFPHPDDEAFSCSGTILSHTERAVPVTYICLTLGEMGRNMGNPLFANRESLPLIRKQEIEEACKILGVQDLQLWGLRDKTIEFEISLAERLHQAILQIKPSLIITFYPGYSVHPDHDACGEAVLQAVQMISAEDRPTLYGVAFSKNCRKQLGDPDIVRDISQYADKKLAVLAAHRSQTEGMLARVTKKKEPEMMKRLKVEEFWTIK
jgi:N-acetylglucosamine malate deacetylase 2